jgi:hypothetical protein
MTSRAGGDPPAERRELKRLREVAQRESVRCELFLQAWTGCARLDPGGLRDGVDFQDAVQRLEIDRHDPGIALADLRLDAADDARTASERDHRCARGHGPVQDGPHLSLVAGSSDDIRWIVEPATERPDDVAIGAAVGVQGTLVVVREADLGEGLRGSQPGGRQRRDLGCALGFT